MLDRETLEFLRALDPSTRSVYKAGLTAFQEFYGKPPRHFLDAVEEDLYRPRSERRRVAWNVLRQFSKWLEDRGYAPKTVRAYVGAIQSLARYYDIPITTRYVNLPPSVPVSRKYPWTLDKVVEFVNMMDDVELKSLTVTLFQSGLSVSDALSLTYGDIRLEYEAGIVPLCLDIVRKKTKVHFMTFIGKWGVMLLRDHLGRRSRIRDDDRLYNLSHRTIDMKFQRIGRKLMGSYKGFNPFRPHSLRAAFRTILADHGVDRTYIEFWMGHKLPEQEATYISKSREGWRETYRKYAEPWLTPKEMIV
jgi:integrase/recombinase XerD